MTVTGHIKNGKIELDDPTLHLEEGTVVSVGIPLQPIPESDNSPPADLPMPSMDPADQKKLAEGMLEFAGALEGFPRDFARNHDHYIHGAPKLP